MEQVELAVTGMSCGACERRIEAALSRLEGVLRSTADHRAARVRIAFDPHRLTEQAVRARIEQAGYVVAP